MAEAPMTVGDALVVLDPAGALWLPDSRTLVVADLHLEKSSSFARHGMLLPPYDTGATLLLLAGLVARREPRRVICLGDSFHDRGGFGRLSATDCAALIALQSGRDWVWITGNHDPELPCDSGGDVQAELRSDGLTFRHEPVAGTAAGEIAGHLHPVGKDPRPRPLRCGGAPLPRMAQRMVLPAFGVLAGGLNVLDRAFAPLFAPGAIRAVLIGDGRLFPVRVCGAQRGLNGCSWAGA
jgi:DNA ligase-associated metallophosphoesterase